MKTYMKSNLNRQILLAFLFLALSILSVYPAFTGHFFKLTMDGQIHLVRFEPIAEAFKHFELPPMVNFKGFGNVGEVFTATYPWIGELIFIIPLALLKNQILAYAIGFVLLNLLTIFNIYLLTKRLTRNVFIQLIGVIIYQFNSYHMIVMFARNAIGEATAYAFLPLVLLGWILIFEHKSTVGVITLSFGLGMIGNSHVITAFYTCLLLLVGLVFAFLYKRIDKNIIKSFLYSGVLTLLLDLFTICNILMILLNNRITTAGKDFKTSQLTDVIDASLNNYIGDKVGYWNIGLVSLILLFLLFSKAVCVKKGNVWRTYTFIAMGIFVVTLSWFNSIDNYLGKTILGNIQFSGRLLSFVMLFLVAALTLYLGSYTNKYDIKVIATVICISTFCLSLLGVREFHYIKNDDPIRYYLTQENYRKTIENPISGWSDYIPIDNSGKPLVNINNPKLKDITKVTYNKISYSFYSKNATDYRLPLLFYKEINYTINGRKVRVTRNLVTIMAKKGNNLVTVSSKPTRLSYILFTVSLVTIMVLSVAIVIKV